MANAMKNLTRRQAEVLDWILEVVEEKGYFPSFREIGEAFGMRSPASVARHIDALVRKGWLVREGDRIHPASGGRGARRSRGIPGIHVVGRVAAGEPILAEQHIEDHLDLGSLYGDGVFAVRVVGDSMVEAGILPGDLAIVRSQHRVASGAIALAYLGEEQEATIKVFRWKGDRVELHPRSPGHEPIRVGPDDPHFRLGGKVVGVVRSMR